MHYLPSRQACSTLLWHEVQYPQVERGHTCWAERRDRFIFQQYADMHGDQPQNRPHFLAAGANFIKEKIQVKLKDKLIQLQPFFQQRQEAIDCRWVNSVDLHIRNLALKRC